MNEKSTDYSQMWEILRKLVSRKVILSLEFFMNGKAEVYLILNNYPPSHCLSVMKASWEGTLGRKQKSFENCLVSGAPKELIHNRFATVETSNF